MTNEGDREARGDADKMLVLVAALHAERAAHKESRRVWQRDLDALNRIFDAERARTREVAERVARDLKKWWEEEENRGLSEEPMQATLDRHCPVNER